jgi:hypothetical protein
MFKLTAQDRQALIDVAGKLSVPVDWLAAVINFETAGTWDPMKKNPNSSARGLIQFLDATAQQLGYRNSLDLVTRHNTIASQLRGPVLKYFQQWREPARHKQDFYFRVFLPAYRHAPLDTVIYNGEPAKQAKFRKANPGIVTVGDYFRKLESRFARFKASPGGAGVIIGLAVLGFFLGRVFFK